jgi:anaphase-promoting complex subunit 3
MEDVTNIASSSKTTTYGTGPVATGTGFFTPDATNTFRAWRPDPAPPQPFRMAMPNGFRETMYV